MQNQNTLPNIFWLPVPLPVALATCILSLVTSCRCDHEVSVLLLGIQCLPTSQIFTACKNLPDLGCPSNSGPGMNGSVPRQVMTMPVNFTGTFGSTLEKLNMIECLDSQLRPHNFTSLVMGQEPVAKPFRMCSWRFLISVFAYSPYITFSHAVGEGYCKP